MRRGGWIAIGIDKDQRHTQMGADHHVTRGRCCPFGLHQGLARHHKAQRQERCQGKVFQTPVHTRDIGMIGGSWNRLLRACYSIPKMTEYP